MNDRTVSSLPPRSRAASTAISPRRTGRRRLLRGDQRGAAIVEFALVIPIFVFMLYGLITFGLILAQKQQITNAAADGARAAVGAADLAAAKSAATTRVQNSLGPPTAYSISFNQPGDPDYDAAIQASGACGSRQCITVRIKYDYANHPIVPPAPGLGVVTPNSFRSTAVVQYS